MDSSELQRVYGDSHTLDRPVLDEAPARKARRGDRPYHPLDNPRVIEEATSQGWGC